MEKRLCLLPCKKHPGNIKLILLLLQYDAIPSESFGDDISVQLLKYATVKRSKTMQKLIDGNFINLTSESTFLAAFDFAFKRKNSDYDIYPQIEHLFTEAAY